MTDPNVRPDRAAAQAALDKTPSDMMRTAAAIEQSRELMRAVRATRERNHIANKFRAIIVGHQ